ncbi:MAG: DUF6782 family putative metallopeptidase [Alphaproteobacteria bacterium]
MQNKTKNTAKAPKTDGARLAAARKRLAADPDGKKLLALARQKGVPIFFSADREMDAAGRFDGADKTIALARDLDSKALACVLAHELRHLWQAGIANLGERYLSAADALVRRRLIEGDALAFEKRFMLSSQLKQFEKMTEKLLQLQASPAAVEAMKVVSDMRVKFGMKGCFIEAQKKRMGPYDRKTLRSLTLLLQMAQIYAREKKRLNTHPSKSSRLEKGRSACDRELKRIFRRVSSPQKLDRGLINITRETLAPGSPNYLGFTTTKDLAAYVRAQIPAKTLKKAQALEKKIRKTAGQALGK